jgi:hypothetical protein
MSTSDRRKYREPATSQSVGRVAGAKYGRVAHLIALITLISLISHLALSLYPAMTDYTAPIDNVQ